MTSNIFIVTVLIKHSFVDEICNAYETFSHTTSLITKNKNKEKMFFSIKNYSVEK